MALKKQSLVLRGPDCQKSSRDQRGAGENGDHNREVDDDVSAVCRPVRFKLSVTIVYEVFIKKNCKIKAKID